MKRERHAAGEVNVHVKGKNLTVTPALRDQVVNKMKRLDKYFDRLQQIDVELSTESTRDADQHSHVQATTHVLGRSIRVTTAHSEMYAAIDEAVDKLYRQLNRRKERVKAHHGTKLAELLPPDGGGDIDSDAVSPNGAAQPADIRVEHQDVEPMFEEDAMAEMEAGSRAFFVFLNARNERLNVLYRRGDGQYGLIEPRMR